MSASRYRDALDRLASLEVRGMRLGLERTEALVGALGNPHTGLRGALIAGTNGKGSVSALVDAMARAAGLRSVLLTKPHLVSWRERIVIDGEPVSEEDFASLLDETLAAASTLPGDLAYPTVFEVVTAMGVLAAARAAPDLVVCEVGLGGRLDSTNVLDLGVAVLTSVALDHREQLGDTLEGIAAEKAAIIKRGNHVVSAAEPPAFEVVEQAARDRGAAAFIDVRTHAGEVADRGRDGVTAVVDGTRFATPLIGLHQATNLATAVCVAHSLGARGQAIDDDAILRGASAVQWPGRLQWIDGAPPVLVDGAHNTAAMEGFVDALRRLRGGRLTAVVVGMMADKDVDDMLDVLHTADVVPVFTAVDLPRAMPAAELGRRWGEGAHTAPGVVAALAAAREIATAGGLVAACGSLYVVGEVLAAVAAAGAATGLRAFD